MAACLQVHARAPAPRHHGRAEAPTAAPRYGSRMSFLRRLFGGADESPETLAVTDERQRVTVLLRLSDPELTNEREQLAVYALEDRLMQALDEGGVGTHETNELERGYLRIQLLGKDADRILDAIRPLLADAPRGSYLAVRRGPEGSTEERLELEPEEDGGG
jgi:hypothetical protein